MFYRMTCSEVLRKIGRREKVTFVDLRSRELYDSIHIPGAMHIAKERLKDLTPQYIPDRGRQIILYGGSDGPEATLQCAQELEAMGYLNIFACTGGFDHWRDDGLSCEASTPTFRLNFL